MSALQIAAVMVSMLLLGIDGFDVLAISFAAPGITAEWGIDRGALGVVLLMELIGMSLGSLCLGAVADRFGRRPTILGCLALMSTGVFMVTRVTTIPELELWRVTTGVGIGGLLAVYNAVAAEFSNLRRRDLSVSVMAVGYPVGAILGGLIVAQFLQTQGWRAVFYFGAAVSAIAIPLVWVLIPESIEWLTDKQPTGAQLRINRTLRRMGHPVSVSLPTPSNRRVEPGVRSLFGPRLALVAL